MIVHPDVKIPSFPLLSIKSSLALLKPCIFENFEHGEQHPHSAETICFTRAMPVFGNRDECAHLIEIGGLWTNESDQRLGQRINNHRTLRARVLPDLHRQIKQRCNHSDGRYYLRERADRFQAHTPIFIKPDRN